MGLDQYLAHNLPSVISESDRDWSVYRSINCLYSDKWFLRNSFADIYLHYYCGTISAKNKSLRSNFMLKEHMTGITYNRSNLIKTVCIKIKTIPVSRTYFCLAWTFFTASVPYHGTNFETVQRWSLKSQMDITKGGFCKDFCCILTQVFTIECKTFP